MEEKKKRKEKERHKKKFCFFWLKIEVENEFYKKKLRAKIVKIRFLLCLKVLTIKEFYLFIDFEIIVSSIERNV